ncbi:hypothetical protein HDU96_001820, partial [Phlyctochytrium bullatum]
MPSSGTSGGGALVSSLSSIRSLPGAALLSRKAAAIAIPSAASQAQSSKASSSSARTTCKCGSTNIEYEGNLGHSVCVDCGEVLEENAIVSETTFTETSKGAAVAEGVRVDLNSAWASSRSTGTGSIRMNALQARDITIAN